MKPLRLIALACLTFSVALTSCGDDDDATVDAAALVGTWRFADSESTTETTINSGNQSQSTTTILRDEDVDATLTFNADGSYSQDGGGTFQFTTTQDGTVVFDDVQTIDLTQSGTYRVDGNRLVGLAATSSTMQATQGESSVMFSIQGSRLTFNVDTAFTLDQSGITTTNDFTAVQVYERQ